MSINRTSLVLGIITVSFLLVMIAAEINGFNVLAGMTSLMKP